MNIFKSIIPHYQHTSDPSKGFLYAIHEKKDFTSEKWINGGYTGKGFLDAISEENKSPCIGYLFATIHKIPEENKSACYIDQTVRKALLKSDVIYMEQKRLEGPFNNVEKKLQSHVYYEMNNVHIIDLNPNSNRSTTKSDTRFEENDISILGYQTGQFLSFSGGSKKYKKSDQLAENILYRMQFHKKKLPFFAVDAKYLIDGRDHTFINKINSKYHLKRV